MRAFQLFLSQYAYVITYNSVLTNFKFTFMTEYKDTFSSEDIPNPLIDIKNRLIMVRHGCDESCWFSVYKGRKRLAKYSPDELYQLMCDLFDNHFHASIRWTSTNVIEKYALSIAQNDAGNPDLALKITFAQGSSLTTDVRVCNIRSVVGYPVGCLIFDGSTEYILLNAILNAKVVNIYDIESFSDWEIAGYRKSVDHYAFNFAESYKNKRLLTHRQRVIDIFTAYEL